MLLASLRYVTVPTTDTDGAAGRSAEQGQPGGQRR